MLHSIVKYAVPAADYDISQMETMGERIRTLRQAHGLTQSQLANLCDVTKSAVSQWEIGATSNIRLKPLLLLVDALRTDLAYLIYGRGRRAEPPDPHGHTPRKSG